MTDASVATPRARRRVKTWFNAVVRRPWLAWWLTRVLALSLGAVMALIHRGNVFYDITYYAKWAHGTLTGSAIPYHDFSWEYPPAALPSMVIPGAYAPLFGSTPTNAYLIVYTGVWIAAVLALDAAITSLLLRHTGRDLRHPATLVWVLGLPILGALSWSRFDLLPAATALIAVWLAGRSRINESGLASGLGATLKLWPALLAPLQRTRRAAVTATVTAGLFVVAVAGITFAATGSTGFAQVLNYQSKRGLQIESLFALPLVWLKKLGVDGYDKQFAFGAWEVTGAGAETLAKLATVVFLSSLVAVGLIHWRLMKVDAGRRGIALSAVTVMLVVLVTNKVFSPQYVLWLIAVVAAASLLDPQMWKPFIPWVLGLAALTHVVFPLFYGDILGSGGWVGLIALTARDVLLVGMLVVVMGRLINELRLVRTRDAIDDRDLDDEFARPLER